MVDMTVRSRKLGPGPARSFLDTVNYCLGPASPCGNNEVSRLAQRRLVATRRVLILELELVQQLGFAQARAIRDLPRIAIGALQAARTAIAHARHDFLQRGADGGALHCTAVIDDFVVFE